MQRVFLWNKRTPSRCSKRATHLPIADDDNPSCRPASVKLQVSAARKKTFKAARLSKLVPLTVDECLIGFGSAVEGCTSDTVRLTHLASRSAVRAMDTRLSPACRRASGPADSTVGGDGMLDTLFALSLRVRLPSVVVAFSMPAGY